MNTDQSALEILAELNEIYAEDLKGGVVQSVARRQLVIIRALNQAKAEVLESVAQGCNGDVSADELRSIAQEYRQDND